MPIRMCVFCRKKLPKSEMKRFVLRGEEVIEDKLKKLNGRGAYCCLDDMCIARLKNDKKGLLKKALMKKNASNNEV